MKRISYAGGTLETSDAVTQALLDYITSVAQSDMNISVDIPVRESSGNVTSHSIILGPGTQLDVTDSADAGSGDEAIDFPVPDFDKTVELADMEPSADADRAAKEFDRAVADIENQLDEQGA
ncbi:MAG: hypothetical protein ABI238_02550 [Terrimesophilobacter sp.]